MRMNLRILNRYKIMDIHQKKMFPCKIKSIYKYNTENNNNQTTPGVNDNILNIM